MIEELRILLHLFLLVLVTAYDRPFIHTKNQEQRAPFFNRTPDNYTYEAGELAILKCDVKHLGKRRVGWRRASQPNPLTIGTMTFVEDERIRVEHPPFTTEWNLMIKRVSVEDAGVYECQVASKARHLRKLILLTVKERKVEVTNMPSEPPLEGSDELYDIQITGAKYVEQGQEIYLVCKATGKDHSPDDLDWFKNGNKLTTEFARKLYIRKVVSLTTKTIVSILKIENAKLHDSGVYVCRTSDLQITSEHVNVLKTDRDQRKRGTATQGPAGGSSGVDVCRSFISTAVLSLVSLLTAKYVLDLVAR